MYRGDSFICAAIHADFIDNKSGGCATVSLIGNQSNFCSFKRNSILSIAFYSNFSLAFTPTTKLIANKNDIFNKIAVKCKACRA